jgi:hypothetical protein
MFAVGALIAERPYREQISGSVRFLVDQGVMASQNIRAEARSFCEEFCERFARRGP